MEPAPKKDLAGLRELLARYQAPLAERELLAFAEAPGGGIARGALTEVSGPDGAGKTSFVLRFLAAHPELRVAWLEAPFTAYPPAFPRHGVEPERLLFVDAPEEHALWAAHQLIRSQLFDVVVLRAEIADTAALRRLQLEAERARASVIRLAEEATSARGAGSTWMIDRQIRISRAEVSEGDTRCATRDSG
jgi:hypothetical protein